MNEKLKTILLGTEGENGLRLFFGLGITIGIGLGVGISFLFRNKLHQLEIKEISKSSLRKKKNENKKLEVIEAPRAFDSGQAVTLFLGGGISGCPNWQEEVILALKKPCRGLCLVNPRRTGLTLNDIDPKQQIEWEYHALRQSDAIMFWFCEETLCPITLYELGSWNMTSRKLFVGCHPNYKRKLDVEIQTGLVRPDIKVVDSLDELVEQIIKWYQSI
jgi:hypothetical protein